MESQPQNPEFRINPENFHPCETHRHKQKQDQRSNKGKSSHHCGYTLWKAPLASGLS